ncbi:restriction endonuclease subunit S [Lysinibacillus capsici]|uniref:restriction endonuclease subunit S n=1 Tax=Lysinibacillus capsici TaxID=2115968 RepID=UPI003081C690|nr:restriction endonuclease subunit S [Lysinibacillus capsici]
MKVGTVFSKDLFRRLDVKYHFSDHIELDDYKTIGELKDIVVRDPSCYGFRYVESGIPILRISDLNIPFLDYTNVAYISENTHSTYKKTHLEKYDILMSVRGVSIGKIGIYMGEYPKANISPNIIIIRLKDKTYARYVAMFLASNLGQSQIKRSEGGSSKPTINASFINEIQIPTPTDEVLVQINKLFDEAYAKRNSADSIIKKIEHTFNEQFKHPKEDKAITYKVNNLTLFSRWDPHYHNPKYQKLRLAVDGLKNTKKLKELAIRCEETIPKNYEEKLGYVEISHVDNITAQITDMKYNYLKSLPTGGKIILKDKDILISKVRPYRGSITIFKDHNKYLVTASKNAFSVYRTDDFMYPYYLTAFIRYRIGLDQIVMQQSGTSYPTVNDDEIGDIKIPILDEPTMKIVDDLFKDYMSTRELEESNLKSIHEIFETTFG